MRIRHRLIRLERITRSRAFPPTEVSCDRPLSEDEEADRTGEFLWLTACWERHAQQLARDPQTADKAAAYRAWDLAAKAARAGGRPAYHVGLRTEAMAVWLWFNAEQEAAFSQEFPLHALEQAERAGAM